MFIANGLSRHVNNFYPSLSLTVSVYEPWAIFTYGNRYIPKTRTIPKRQTGYQNKSKNRVHRTDSGAKRRGQFA